jgi:hypothetical protein
MENKINDNDSLQACGQFHHPQGMDVFPGLKFIGVVT